jgi:hypothetical protein
LERSSDQPKNRLHGMLTTHADTLNPDLLAFIQS